MANSLLLLALLSFGLWGFFTKLAIVYIDSKSALSFQTAGVFNCWHYYHFFLNFKLASDIKGLGFGFINRYCLWGWLFIYFVAADKGKIVTVVTLTALYPYDYYPYLLLKEELILNNYLVLVSLFLLFILCPQ